MPNCLNNMTWEALKRLGMAAPATVHLGDFKDDVLKNGNPVQFRVIGINHDVTSDGQIVPLTWEMVDCMPSRYPWCRNGDVDGSWPDSYLFRAMNDPDGDVYRLMPDGIIEVAVSIVKPTAKVTDDSFEIVNSTAKFFIKSEAETFGRVIYSAPGEGHWYGWYRQEGVPWYKLRNGGREYTMERSPVKGCPGAFCTVYTNGDASYYNARVSSGLAPAFGF